MHGKALDGGGGAAAHLAHAAPHRILGETAEHVHRSVACKELCESRILVLTLAYKA